MRLFEPKPSEIPPKVDFDLLSRFPSRSLLFLLQNPARGILRKGRAERRDLGMASWAISSGGSGFRPFPAAFHRSRSGLRSPVCIPPLRSVSGGDGLLDSFRPVGLGRLSGWALGVSAPARVPTLDEAVANGEPRDEGAGKAEAFDPGMPPSFGLTEIRAAIPKHCWVKNPWRSMSYVVRDVVVVLGLAVAAARLDNWIMWPLYWVAQGTMFWALFVLGHDCGHGSFSNNPKMNSFVGHLLHSSILVPYHGWRISHRTHHQSHGHVENDESWHPLSEKVYKSLDTLTRVLRFTMPFPLLAFPLYLFARTPGKSGTHFDPSSDLFLPNEKKDVITSTACWIAMVGLLVGLTCFMGPIQMLKLYGIPYVFFVMWLDLVTYLHHHGHKENLPWYRSKEWSYLRGGLTTLDRDYGWINNIHHDIGTHVIHHLFPQIPHYHLVEATEAAKPVLGKYYREPEKSGPLPLHLFRVFARSLNHDHFVPDTGDIVYYQTDDQSHSS